VLRRERKFELPLAASRLPYSHASLLIRLVAQDEITIEVILTTYACRDTGPQCQHKFCTVESADVPLLCNFKLSSQSGYSTVVSTPFDPSEKVSRFEQRRHCCFRRTVVPHIGNCNHQHHHLAKATATTKCDKLLMTSQKVKIGAKHDWQM
jgi:hypothetical protein